MGELHRTDSCAYCGHGEELVLTVLVSTRAVAPVCEDVVACVRRRQRR